MDKQTLTLPDNRLLALQRKELSSQEKTQRNFNHILQNEKIICCMIPAIIHSEKGIIQTVKESVLIGGW